MKQFFTLAILTLIAVGCTNNRFKTADLSPKVRPLGKVCPPIVERKTDDALIRYEYSECELASLCEASMAKATAGLDAIAKTDSKDRNFANTMLAFENTMADLMDETNVYAFMKYVSTNKGIRSEGAECEEKVAQYVVFVFTKKELYDSLKDQQGTTAAEKRLVSETLKSFEKNGLKLDGKDLDEVRALKTKLAELEANFGENLNNDSSFITATAEELDGLPDTILKALEKTEDGKFKVTTQNPVYVPVMENVKSAEIRRRMLFEYNNRQFEVNTKLLEEAIVLRQKIKDKMGFKTWADYRIDGRMAKDGETVLKFLGTVQSKLRERQRGELAKLLEFKKTYDPTATKIESWDLSYTSYQLKKRDFKLDNEVIKQYFPTDSVVKNTFDIYSQILGVTFKEVKNAKVWNPDVKLYKIIDKESKRLVAYFFADFIPREGKYKHAAAFSLILGRENDGEYTYPVSSIVSNFALPTKDKPSLLTHAEVETFFHEFGHIMHQTLTRAPYASLSGTSVSQDFVEAPSQMLENWVWNEDILSKVSGHYKDGSKLPPDLLKRMLAAKDYNQGMFYTRQLFLALEDMEMHTRSGPIDVTKLADEMYLDIIGVEPIPDGHFNASFGHLMGGYDAAYYGYMWSEVYAQDMFTLFENTNPLDEKTGLRYRKIILEQGNMSDAIDLLREFLGREPNPDAFYKSLGIQN